MSEFISNNKDCIAIIISIISLLLSIYNFISALFAKKCSIKIIVNSYSKYNDTCRFFLTIENCSQLPVSISSIKLNSTYNCVLKPTVVEEHTKRSGNTIVSRTEILSIAFPINLNSLESCSGYVDFRNIENFDLSTAKFSLSTNRKFIKNVDVTINDDLTK